MMYEMPPTMRQDSNLSIRSETCAHSRIVDDVLNATGTKTGQLICLECRAVFPDPSIHGQAY